MISGWWKGEKKVALKACLYLLVLWVDYIFGIKLEFRITISDLSKSFVSGFHEVFCESLILTYYMYVLGGLADEEEAFHQ